MEKKNTWETYSHKQLKEAEAFAKEYMQFLDEGKTERECVDTIVNTIERKSAADVISMDKKIAQPETQTDNKQFPAISM